MKKFVLAVSLMLSALPALAQRHYSCQVVMVDRYNRIIQRFYAQADYRTGMCRDGLRDCNYEIRRRGLYGVRCAQVRGNGW
jgi:hypothetical protein